MSDPFFNPFGEADSCSTCPANQFATTSNNDDLSCCASVTDGSCTACNSAIASGCTAVTCDTGFVSFVVAVVSFYNARFIFMQEISFLIFPLIIISTTATVLYIFSTNLVLLVPILGVLHVRTKRIVLSVLPYVVLSRPQKQNVQKLLQGIILLATLQLFVLQPIPQHVLAMLLVPLVFKP